MAGSRVLERAGTIGLPFRQPVDDPGRPWEHPLPPAHALFVLRTRPTARGTVLRRVRSRRRHGRGGRTASVRPRPPCRGGAAGAPAFHLGAEIGHYARELRLAEGLSFSVRMGLNSGEVVVGAIGDDLHMDYTALGATVGLAQRMEQLAEPGKVYLTEHTARLVEGFFRLEELGPFSVKGLRDRVRVYELEGPGPLKTRLDLSRARGLSRFIGREDETAALEAALGRAVEGRGGVVGIVAEAGVGKSRLCYEFVERIGARGLAVHQAHCVAHGRMVPFLPILELLRAFFGISEQDGSEAA